MVRRISGPEASIRPASPLAGTVRAGLRRLAITGGLELAGLAARMGMLRQAAGLGIVFMLHHVRPCAPRDFDPNALLSVTPDFLDAALSRLKGMGMRPVDLADLGEILKRNDPADPVFAVTLDDGYRDNLEHALPVFERHGVPFTIFVTTGFVERRCSLWWETAEELLRHAAELRIDLGSGPQHFAVDSTARKLALFRALLPVMTGPAQDQAIAALDRAAESAGLAPLEITDRLMMTEREVRELARHPLARLEPHTICHPALGHVDSSRLRTEIMGSAERLQDWTGRAPRFFAYPYGWPAAAGAREFAAVKDAGLELAVTTRPGVLRPGHAGTPAALPRAALNGLFQQPRYVAALASGIPFGLAGLIRR